MYIAPTVDSGCKGAQQKSIRHPKRGLIMDVDVGVNDGVALGICFLNHGTHGSDQCNQIPKTMAVTIDAKISLS